MSCLKVLRENVKSLELPIYFKLQTFFLCLCHLCSVEVSLILCVSCNGEIREDF